MENQKYNLKRLKHEGGIMQEALRKSFLIFCIILSSHAPCFAAEEYGLVDAVWFTDGEYFVFSFEPIHIREVELWIDNPPICYRIGEFYYPVVTLKQFEEYINIYQTYNKVESKNENNL